MDVYAVACALFVVPIVSSVVASWPIGFIALSVLLLTIRRCSDGLLLTAGLLPLFSLFGRFLDPPLDGRAAGELLVLPFVAAASARAAFAADAGSNRLDRGVAAAAMVVAATAVVGLARQPGSAVSVAAHCWRHPTTG